MKQRQAVDAEKEEVKNEIEKATAVNIIKIDPIEKSDTTSHFYVDLDTLLEISIDIESEKCKV